MQYDLLAFWHMRAPKRAMNWRLPVPIVDQLTEYAAQSHRTVTAVVVALLEQGLKNAIRRGDYVPGATTRKPS